MKATSLLLLLVLLSAAVPAAEAGDDYCVDVDSHALPPVWVTPEDCTPPGLDHLFRVQDP
ncbi:MAG TPA: hypothetical protein VI997_11890 [Candidatus Thermoplasmatota archaeon]|nr:hypothetical protein [Candidatus Thermoplasmatota archaeon]